MISSWLAVFKASFGRTFPTAFDILGDLRKRVFDKSGLWDEEACFIPMPRPAGSGEDDKKAAQQANYHQLPLLRCHKNGWPIGDRLTEDDAMQGRRETGAAVVPEIARQIAEAESRQMKEAAGSCRSAAALSA